MGFLARVVIILDLRETLARCLFGKRIEKQRRIGYIIEQHVHPLVEKRQPMLEAGMATAFAHRLVQCVAARLCAERRNVALPEALDALRGQLHFAHWHEIERAKLPGRALRLGIERADRFKCVAEEIEANRRPHARRPEVENAAAHRIFAGLAHRARTQVTVRLEPAQKLVGIDRIPRRGGECFGGNAGARRHALHERIDRRRQNARALDR